MAEILQDVVNAVSLGALYALFAVGLALVFSIAGIANFAYGDFAMVAGYVLVLVVALVWPLVVVVVIVAAMLLAVASDRLAFRPLRAADATTLLVASFALSSLLQHVMRGIAGNQPKGVDFGASVARPISIGDVTVPRLDLLTIVVVALTLLGLTLFLRRSFLGMQLRAAAEDFTMARLLGVPANRLIAAAFGLSGAIAGIAALLLTIRSGAVSIEMGLQPVLVAFVAIVVGGMGSLSAAALGGLLLGVVSVLLEVLLPPDLKPYRDAFLFTFVVLVLLVRPQGLFVARGAEARI